MSEPHKTIIDQMNVLKNQYYAENEKNIFFRNKQKNKVASIINENMNINDILGKTMFIMKNDDCIYFDYTVFKLYAHPSNYSIIISNLLKLLNSCIDKHGRYEIHINLHTFSISSLERYRDCIDLYCNECLKANTEYYKNMVCMHIYNTPSVIDTISTLLSKMIHTEVKQKVKKYGKIESESIIQNIVSSVAV